jgi:hypothetical protein
MDWAAIIIAKKTECGKPIAAKVAKGYVASLELLHQAAKKTRKMPDLAWLKKEKTVERGLKKHGYLDGNEGTLEKTYSHIISVMQVMKWERCKAYKNFVCKRDELTAKKRAAVKSGKCRELSPREKANWVHLADLQALHAEERAALAPLLADDADPEVCKKDSRLENYVLVSTFMEKPSRLDCGDVELCNPGGATDLAVNYLELSSPYRFVIHVWTNGSRSETGERIIEVDQPQLQQLLEHFISKMGKCVGNTLFSSAGKKLATNAAGIRFTTYWTKQLKGTADEGKRIPMTLYRKIESTYNHGPAIEALEKSAHDHGHSVETKKNHYIKKLPDGMLQPKGLKRKRDINEMV